MRNSGKEECSLIPDKNLPAPTEKIEPHALTARSLKIGEREVPGAYVQYVTKPERAKFSKFKM